MWLVNGASYFAPLLWLPLVLLIAVVAPFRRPRLTLLAAVPLLIWGALTVSPSVYLALPQTCDARLPSLRVATVNVLMTNQQLGQLAEDVMEEDPDIVVFQELLHDLDAMSPALAEAYPHRFSTIVPWVTIASRIPLEETRRLTLPGDDRGRDPLAATIDAAGQKVTVLAVHMTPPRDTASFKQHKEQYDLLIAEADRSRNPIVAIGDFNATALSPAFGSFLRSTRLRIVSQDRIADPTYYLPGRIGIRIDHVLVRDLVTCEGRVFSLTGSDHRGVLAEIGLGRTPTSE